MQQYLLNSSLKTRSKSRPSDSNVFWRSSGRVSGSIHEDLAGATQQHARHAVTPLPNWHHQDDPRRLRECNAAFETPWSPAHGALLSQRLPAARNRTPSVQPMIITGGFLLVCSVCTLAAAVACAKARCTQQEIRTTQYMYVSIHSTDRTKACVGATIAGFGLGDCP